MSSSPDFGLQRKLFGTQALSADRAAMIKQSYILLSLSVFSALVGGYIGATSHVMVRLFSSVIGWILSLVILNVVPRIAIAARHNPVLGISALVLDGFLSGIVLTPLLYYASRVAPAFVPAALGITAIVFFGVTLFVMTSGRTFSAPKGLMMGLFVSILGAIILNSFLHLGVIGIVISMGIGVMGVLILVYATSEVLNNPEVDSPIPGALMLFAGLFNVFVAVLNLLLRLSSRD